VPDGSHGNENCGGDRFGGPGLRVADAPLPAENSAFFALFRRATIAREGEASYPGMVKYL
jgi:hypothetical protein